jgi:hypothetical protein
MQHFKNIRHSAFYLNTLSRVPLIFSNRLGEIISRQGNNGKGQRRAGAPARPDVSAGQGTTG